jgi:hypothetical protein
MATKAPIIDQVSHTLIVHLQNHWNLDLLPNALNNLPNEQPCMLVVVLSSSASVTDNFMVAYMTNFDITGIPFILVQLPDTLFVVSRH